MTHKRIELADGTTKNFPITLIGDPGHAAAQAETYRRLLTEKLADPEPLIVSRSFGDALRNAGILTGYQVES